MTSQNARFWLPNETQNASKIASKIVLIFETILERLSSPFGTQNETKKQQSDPRRTTHGTPKLSKLRPKQPYNVQNGSDPKAFKMELKTLPRPFDKRSKKQPKCIHHVALIGLTALGKLCILSPFTPSATRGGKETTFEHIFRKL